MTNNYLPWLFFAGAVLFTLYMKGWLSGLKSPRGRMQPKPGPGLVPPARGPAPQYSAAELGRMFIEQSRIEIEREMAQALAEQQYDQLRRAFKSPFTAAGEGGNPADPAAAP